jgi:Tfp pilus assembly protein PilV
MMRMMIGDSRILLSDDGPLPGNADGVTVTQVAGHRSQVSSRELRVASRSAFSLTEVVIALGVVSFALIAIFGLLPVGLKTVKNANEQAAAANLLGAIADAVRNASTNASATTYSNSIAGQGIGYILGSTNPTTNTLNNLTLEGASNSISARLKAVVVISPPANIMTNGRALISVAWPATASNSGSISNLTWSRADGFVTSGIQFLPKP